MKRCNKCGTTTNTHSCLSCDVKTIYDDFNDPVKEPKNPVPVLTIKDKLFHSHGKFCDKARGVVRAKNSDYAHGDDPFKNFRRHGVKGFIVRMDDKISRLESITEKGSTEVKDESLEDTCIDLANYAFLLLEFVRQSKK